MKTVGAGIVFAIGSFLADAAVIGVLAALALWAWSYIELSRAARSALALATALAPVFIADVLWYQLLAYLGDTDTGLIFSIANRSLSELLAVASWRLVAPASVVLGLGVLFGGAAWALNRYVIGAAGRAPRPRPTRTHLFWLAALVGAGVCATTVGRMTNEALDFGLRQKPSGYALSHLISLLSDFDGDGFGLFSRPPDPDPFDARVFPYAQEIPGNGIDENGVGGDLPWERTDDAPQRRFGHDWKVRPDLVLIFLESVRADVVGLVHAGLPVTPVLNGLAARGVSARLAFSHNGFTTPSRYHLFSGRLAHRDGTTLIDDFKANGYHVAYFSGQDESFGGPNWDVGFARADVAYDARQDVQRRYSTQTTPGSLAVPFGVVQERVNAFLAERRSTQPLFLYINLADTHFPYHHPGIQPLISRTVLPRSQISPRRTDDLRTMYLNSVANVDRAVGEIIESIRRSLGRDPAIIVTADHGESLFENGYLGHGWALNDIQTRIPLIVANLPIVIQEPFGQADLRGAIDGALRDVFAARLPAVTEKASGTVFQYLGAFRRPAQIAWTNRAGQTIYDFRTRKFRENMQEWRRPADLTPPELQAFLELVHSWERLVFAGAASQRGSDQRTP